MAAGRSTFRLTNRKQETKQGLFSSTSGWVNKMHIVDSLDFLSSSFFFSTPGFPPQSASQDIERWQWDRLHLKCQQFAALHRQGKSTFMCKRRTKLKLNLMSAQVPGPPAGLRLFSRLSVPERLRVLSGAFAYSIQLQQSWDKKQPKKRIMEKEM